LASTRDQLALTWGVRTFVVPAVEDTDAMIEQVDHAVLRIAGYQVGDTVVIVAGSKSGFTNLIRVHRLGHQD
jgi:pyruvate kinase